MKRGQGKISYRRQLTKKIKIIIFFENDSSRKKILNYYIIWKTIIWKNNIKNNDFKK